MPTRAQTIKDAISIFESAVYPHGLTHSSCWLGIYQTILWYEPINHLGFNFLPHIIDSDKLRPSSKTRERSWKRPSIWQRRADAVNSYLAKQLGCDSNELPNKTDLLLNQPQYSGLQRQNVLGTAFVGLITHILEKNGSSKFNFSVEVEATSVFPGIRFPGRSITPRMDILIQSIDSPFAILSAKWSLRHDRLNDITN